MVLNGGTEAENMLNVELLVILRESKNWFKATNEVEQSVWVFIIDVWICDGERTMKSCLEEFLLKSAFNVKK